MSVTLPVFLICLGVLLSSTGDALISTKPSSNNPKASRRISTVCLAAAGGRSSISSKIKQQLQKQEDSTTTSPHREPCNVVFTHTNADFDSLAAAVALSLLWSKSDKPELPTHVVLPRGTHPVVQRFLAFHKHLLPLRGFKTIMPEDVHAIGVVDAQGASRIGRGQSWLDNAQSIHIYDHHDGQLPSKKKKGKSDTDGNAANASQNKEESPSSPPSLVDRATEVVIDKVGSTTTLLVEKLKDAGITPAPHEATLFCLGIRADTGGLVYESTTLRDAAALLWCMQNGASQTAISEFGVTKMTGETQRIVLQTALRDAHTDVVNGLRVSSVLVSTDDSQDTYVAGLAQVCEEIMDLTDSDVFLLGATHKSGSGGNNKSQNRKKAAGGGKSCTQWISLIGRASARAVGVDLNYVMHQFQGGGHPKAAAAALRCKNDDQYSMHHDDAEEESSEGGDHISADREIVSVEELVCLANSGELSAQAALDTAVQMIQDQIPEQLIASSFMNPNVITVDMDCTVAEAHTLFEEYKLKSTPIVDQYGKFKSSLKLSDIVKAVRAGRSNDKIKSMIRPGIKTVLPDTELAELEHLLIHEGVGRIPVIDDEGILLGLITRTDVLRQHNFYEDKHIV